MPLTALALGPSVGACVLPRRMAQRDSRPALEVVPDRLVGSLIYFRSQVLAGGRVVGSGCPVRAPAGVGVGMLSRHIASFAIE